MNPICIASPPAERAPDGLLEGGQVGGEVRAEMDVDDGPIGRLERLAVAAGLGVDEPSERVRPARDRAIDRMVGRRAAGTRPSAGRPCGLAGRVEEAGP